MKYIIESFVEVRDLAATLQTAAVPVLPAPAATIVLVEDELVCHSERLRVQQLILLCRAVGGRRLRPGAFLLTGRNSE